MNRIEVKEIPLQEFLLMQFGMPAVQLSINAEKQATGQALQQGQPSATRHDRPHPFTPPHEAMESCLQCPALDLSKMFTREASCGVGRFQARYWQNEPKKQFRLVPTSYQCTCQAELPSCTGFGECVDPTTYELVPCPLCGGLGCSDWGM